MYKFSGYTIKVVFTLRGGIKVYQKENLPTDRGFVIACTHEGFVDVLALGAGILPFEIHYMAKKELFANKWIGGFLKKIHAFPVDRENPGPSSIKTPIKLLKEGKIVGIFPSGTRTTEDVPLKRCGYYCLDSVKRQSFQRTKDRPMRKVFSKRGKCA